MLICKSLFISFWVLFLLKISKLILAHIHCIFFNDTDLTKGYDTQVDIFTVVALYCKLHIDLLNIYFLLLYVLWSHVNQSRKQFTIFIYSVLHCITMMCTFMYKLKEYSVILTSFYDVNQKIQTKKAYFQSFSWFQFHVCKLCMIMCIGIAPSDYGVTLCKKLLWLYKEVISALFLRGNNAA